MSFLTFERRYEFLIFRKAFLFIYLSMKRLWRPAFRAWRGEGGCHRVCKVRRVEYYHAHAPPRSNAGGRGGVSKNVRVHQVADNVRRAHVGGECVTPPHPLDEGASCPAQRRQT